MAVEVKPLFRPEAYRQKLNQFVLPGRVELARPKLVNWSNKLGSGKLDKRKETELLPDFLTDIFGTLLGYSGPASTMADAYTMKREALVEVDGKKADAAFGRFGGNPELTSVVLEGKGPRDVLDRPFAGRKRSAVEQALLYALNMKLDWYLVTNLKETRLYSKLSDQFTYERFDTTALATDENELRRFVYLLGAERILGPNGRNHLDDLFADTKTLGENLTKGYYTVYRTLRKNTFDDLRQHNKDRSPEALLAATQKLLDRILFIAFCEDRNLLPKKSIAKAYEHKDPYNPKPIWDNFKGLFRSVDKGNPPLQINEYNGKLYAKDEFLDSLTVPDSVCEGFKTLASYEYGFETEDEDKRIDVEILGHVFEQSISDLEELQNELAGKDVATRPREQRRTARKETGAFYTPAFITRYIVRETLKPILDARFETLRQSMQSKLKAKTAARAAMETPRVFESKALRGDARDALADFWRNWIEELKTVRVVDPSCGSGAFLIEAFHQLRAVYSEANGYIADLIGATVFDIRRSILEHNLYGVDLNEAAVGIAKLSCWIQTAEDGKKLTSLDHHFRHGNSVVTDEKVHKDAFNWQGTFPEVFKDGGFDAVVGNPPYVRQEWIKEIKPYLEKNYRAYDGTADLYVYFYELGLKLLKPGGRIGYIVTNKWLKAGYGENLRALYGETAWVEQVVDFGHAKQIFPDADVFPCILVARKPNEEKQPAEARVCVIPREQLRIDDLSRQIADEGFSVLPSRFGADAWNLEPPAVTKLMEKLRRNGVPLKDFAGCGSIYGIKTGCNEAFIINTQTRDKLCGTDPKSAEVIRKYLRGQDVDRWSPEWSDEWMIFAKRGIEIENYPAVKQHLEAYREQLEPKPKSHQGDWPGRAGGNYYWFELQASPADVSVYDEPKIVYQEIQFHPCYSLDCDGMLANNKVFLLPTGSLYLLGVLNSPVVWWHNWRYLPHMKDEALTPAGFLMDELPIPKPTDATHDRVEVLVRELIDLKGGRTSGLRALIEWLQTEIGIEKVSNKLHDLIGLSSEELIVEVRKLLPKKKYLSSVDLQRIKVEFNTNVLPLKANALRAEKLEREVSDLVNDAFGLTPAEVKLMWATAPPRMPIGPPE